MAEPIVAPTNLEGTRLTTDLTGRLVDVLISQGLDFIDGGEVTMAFCDSERVVAGPQKLIQKWIIAFLTKVGTVQANDGYGTNFMRNLEQGRIQSDADVRAEFSDASASVAETLFAADIDNPNDDEKLGTAELQDFDITIDKLSMNIRITSQGGPTAEIILPIPLEV